MRRAEPTRTVLGGKMRALRRAQGLTQWDVSIKVGVSSTYVSHIECGTGRLPSANLIRRLAQALDGDQDELLALAGRSDERMLELRDKVRELQSQLQQEQGRSARLEQLLEDKAG